MNSIVAAVAQVVCRDGDTRYNLAHASEFVNTGVNKGAQLILFPEFMPQGYRLTTEIWDSAEPLDGLTAGWLRESAKNNNIYIGTSFLESESGHFYNTFVLASPSGKICGHVRKRHPSIWEAYFFKGDKGPQYIDTEIGRIGVGICFDNHTWEIASAISKSNIDLMLMPHSYCTPTVETRMTSAADIERLNELPCKVAGLYSDLFGVPVVMCNKSGTWDSPVPNRILGDPRDFTFSGRSMIIDSDGTVRVKLGNEETIAEAKITLDPSKKKNMKIPKYSRYIYPGPIGREVLRLMELQGRLFYQTNKTRKEKAGK